MKSRILEETNIKKVNIKTTSYNSFRVYLGPFNDLNSLKNEFNSIKELNFDVEYKYEIIGIRPGEKLHEEMITVSDAMNTIEFDDYYVIVPAIQPWDKSKFIFQSNRSNFISTNLIP